MPIPKTPTPSVPQVLEVELREAAYDAFMRMPDASVAVLARKFRLSESKIQEWAIAGNWEAKRREVARLELLKLRDIDKVMKACGVKDPDQVTVKLYSAHRKLVDSVYNSINEGVGNVREAQAWVTVLGKCRDNDLALRDKLKF